MGERLSLSDCALVPFVMFIGRLVELGGDGTRPRLQAWWEAIQHDEACPRVHREQAAAAKEALGE